MALSDDAIKRLLEWFATFSQTNKEWSHRRKAAKLKIISGSNPRYPIHDGRGIRKNNLYNIITAIRSIELY